MIEGNLADKPSSGARSNADGSWAGKREQVREIIRAEVDKLHPTDDARRALELIIESSVRYTDVDGRLKITVVDQEGHPRTVDRNGRKVDVTIHDLLDELRASHPVLFKSPPKADSHPGNLEDSEPAPSGKSKTSSLESEKPERDWLAVGSVKQSSTDGISQPKADRILFHCRRGRVRLHGWSHKALRTLAKSAASGEAVTFPFVPDRLTRSADSARNFVEGLRGRTASRSRGLALGAAAVAALLGVGAFVLSGRDRPASPQAGMDGPAVTGTVSASAQTANAPVAASSGGSALRGVPDVIDTATLSLQGEVVRLFGVEWAPGGGKPEDLNRYLQGREVVCEPAGGNDTYRCAIGGQDLSRVVLFNGGGKPTSEATPELKAAADKARAAKIGVWSQQ